MHLSDFILVALGVKAATAYPSDTLSSKIPVIPLAHALWPSQSFKTIPNITPPVFNISKSGAPLAAGNILFTPFSGNPTVVDNAALIMTDTGELVWTSPNGQYANLFVQKLDLKPVLHYWTGGHDGTMGYGYVSILDESYTEIYRVCPQAVAVTNMSLTFPCFGDSHESFITERGSIIITMYNITTADLTSVANGPKDGWVYDCIFFDIDIKTNKTLFQWSALEAGIPFADSKAPLGSQFGDGTRNNPYDYFHINSVQAVGDGYFVNGRHMWTSYKLNSTGSIEWQIQGDTGGDFSLPEDGHFAWEHHARIQNSTDTEMILHYMNNFNAAPPFNGTHQSEGLELHLNLSTRTATVLKNLVDLNESVFNDAQGSFDPLPNGNTLLGYGQIPEMKEFGPVGDNDVRMTIRYGYNDNTGLGAQSYRIYRQEWVGTPALPPIAVVDDGVVYMSWNGATGITSWEILAGNTEDELDSMGSVKSTGFETMFKLQDGCGSFVKVAAYRDGMLLRSTNTVVVA